MAERIGFYYLTCVFERLLYKARKCSSQIYVESIFIVFEFKYWREFQLEMKAIIKKVNYYAAEAKKRELTEEEKLDRQKYRQMYLKKFKSQVRGHLENIKIVDTQKLN